ncbi:uncharacterized protein LOC127769630 [Oryza glaberrima]|uniref:uncharacterized protein LOC127769630 n=1 Tax=Oryza glaberrima TaxID=4538 RepID=UPI00224C2138|nr:uncharacterized protein LOC127769630 [Oryza glaberrima]
MEPGCGEGGGGGGGRDERVPQWGAQETRELIAARGEMERESAAAAAARRSAKTLWEAVSARLRERGYRRTAEQCKCKWKNLVNRYKGKETSDPENGRQCPFFDELHAVFTERARTMQQQLLESESGPSVKKKLKRPSGDLSSEDSDDEEDGGGDSGDEKPIRSRKRKTADKRQQSQRMAEKSRTSISSIHELLQDFLVQQQRMDIQWHEMMERRSQERIVFEQEWRQSMQKLEQERLMLEHTWMEREEQRRMREEARAEKRDALLTTLLNKVLQEEAGLVLHLAVCSVALLFPTYARACVGGALPPPPPAAAMAAEEDDDDEEWKVALQQWKSKTYSLSVPLRVVALRGSFPPAWIKDFVEAQGKRLKFSPEFRTNLDVLYSEMSQCLDKGQLQQKSAMAADVVSIGDSWLGYAIRKGLVEPVKNAEEQDWFQSLSNRWKIHLCRNRNGEVDPNGSIWAVPYRWGTVVIAYKKNKFKRHNLKPIQDWGDLWRPELAGKISMVDSPREVIGAVLKHLGSSYNTNDMESEITGGRETVLESLTQLQNQVQLFDSTNYLKSFGVGDVWVAVGWSSDVIPAAKRMSDVAVVVPKSGSSLWADLWAIPSATKFQTDRIGGRTRGPSPLINQWFDFCLQSARSLPFRQDVIPGASPLFLEKPVPEVPQERNKRKPKLETNLVRGAPPLEILEKCEFLEPLSEKALDDYQWLITRMQRPNRGLFGNLLQNISSVLNFKSRV